MGGRILIRKLLRECLRHTQIRLFPHFYVYNLIAREERVLGGAGFNKDGKPCVIHAGAVVLAAGGGVYARNDNHKRMTGDGYAMALEAGLPLVDMEFVQFYPYWFFGTRLAADAHLPALSCGLLMATGSISCETWFGKNVDKLVLIDLQKWPESLFKVEPDSGSRSKLRSIRKKIQDIAWTLAGPIRDEGGLKKALSVLEQVRSDLQALSAGTSGELIQRKEIENSLVATQAVVVSPLARKESRGAFRRVDHPHEGGEEFLRRTAVKQKRMGQDLNVIWEDLG